MNSHREKSIRASGTLPCQCSYSVDCPMCKNCKKFKICIKRIETEEHSSFFEFHSALLVDALKDKLKL